MSQSIIDSGGPKGAAPGQRTRHALSDHAALLIDSTRRSAGPLSSTDGGRRAKG